MQNGKLTLLVKNNFSIIWLISNAILINKGKLMFPNVLLLSKMGHLRVKKWPDKSLSALKKIVATVRKQKNLIF